MAIYVDLTDTFDSWRQKTNLLANSISTYDANVIANLQANVSSLQNNVTLLSSNLTAVYGNINLINANVSGLSSNTTANLTSVYGNISLINANVSGLSSNTTTNLTAVYSNISLTNANVNKLSTVGLIYVVDGGTSALTTGTKGDLIVPFAANIVGWTLLADAAGTAQVDIWKTTFANYPAVLANTITSNATKPRLNSQAANSNVVTSWTTTIAANDVIRYNIDSTSTIKRLTITLTCTRL